MVGHRVLVALAAALVLAGCGAEQPSERVKPSPSASATVQDNAKLTAIELRVQMLDALAHEPYCRIVYEDAEPGKKPTRVELLRESTAMHLQGTDEGVDFEAIVADLITYARIDFEDVLPADEAKIAEARLRGRWFRGGGNSDPIAQYGRLARELAFLQSYGDFEAGTPTLGEPGRIGDVETVTFKTPDGTVFDVRRHGSPLPLRVRTTAGTILYHDYGKKVTVEPPDTRDTVSLSELEEALHPEA